ncbi:hypothetical protein EZV62_019681 [Acer yangbiense]|uniref:Uncharacterized protein n=1 Tax=Acer yangbiense TaxID=1000413 RepID=A0A5C7HCV7_9ROSI|nr:hypothetical protein EZV62_019681 [Acer yangbiense]
MNQELGMILGKMVGLVEELDTGSFVDCLDWFLRVRINMAISKPLKRVLQVMLDNFDEMATIIVQYERLPELSGFGSAEEPRGKRPRGEEEFIENGLRNSTGEGKLIGDQDSGKSIARVKEGKLNQNEELKKSDNEGKSLILGKNNAACSSYNDGIGNHDIDDTSDLVEANYEGSHISDPQNLEILK